MNGISAVELWPGYWISTIIKGHCDPPGIQRLRDSVTTLADMSAFVDAGITTIDCGSTNPDIERIVGSLLQDLKRSHGITFARSIRVHSMLTPDLSVPQAFNQQQIEGTIDQSLARLGVEALDMVLLHWPDQDMSGCLDGLGYLTMMQAKGKVQLIGVANFDTVNLRMLLQSGIDLAAAKVPFSLIDQRPRGAFANLCREYDIALLAYGTLAGGFISQRWLGAPDPGYYFDNPGLTRNRLVIEAFGGWRLFQEFLLILSAIADRHGMTLGSVALRAIHDYADVTAVVLRSVSADDFADHLKAFRFKPTEQDREALASVLAKRRGPSGPIFELEREKLGDKKIQRIAAGESTFIKRGG